MDLFVATQSGLVVVEGEGFEWQIVRRGLNGRFTTSTIAREGVILAGTQDGLFRSDDYGTSWVAADEGLIHRHVRWLAYHPDVSDLEFAGTEPAAIFVSRDGGGSWQERPEAGKLREKFGWWLPYSDGAGCVRGFAFHGERAYAAVEVGAALVSDDRGETWRLAEGATGQPRFGKPPQDHIHPDVHSIEVHPESADLVYAPTGGGFYRSTDGGATWMYLAGSYSRAVWLDPADPEHFVAGLADSSSGRNGRIEETHDGGQTWQLISQTWQRNMVERFTAIGDTVLAVMSGGELLAATPGDWAWQRVLEEVGHVTAVCPMG